MRTVCGLDVHKGSIGEMPRGIRESIFGAYCCFTNRIKVFYQINTIRKL